ncbi:MAG TPA: type II secretion system protein GspC [Candidatus Binatia bacterium]|nr:type II secretion system protein GspC [Candidatus Binatia bacterium]
MAFARRQQLALELVLVALVAYLAATGVSAALRTAVDDVPPAPPATATPSPSTARPLADYAVIATRDIFNPSAGPDAARHRNLRLWGVGLDGHDARAVIEDATTHRQELYRVGDTIGTARVTAIDWDRVTLTDAGIDDTLTLSPPDTTGSSSEPPPVPAVQTAAEERIRRTSENAWVVDRREVVGTEGLSGLMTQLRAVAEVRDGRPAGFRLFQIRDDSLFAKLGLRDGDVVQRVNGAEVAEPAALLGFLQRLKTEPRVALDIVRGATPRTLVYDLR